MPLSSKIKKKSVADFYFFVVFFAVVFAFVAVVDFVLAALVVADFVVDFVVFASAGFVVFGSAVAFFVVVDVVFALADFVVEETGFVLATFAVLLVAGFAVAVLVVALLVAGFAGVSFASTFVSAACFFVVVVFFGSTFVVDFAVFVASAFFVSLLVVAVLASVAFAFVEVVDFTLAFFVEDFVVDFVVFASAGFVAFGFSSTATEIVGSLATTASLAFTDLAGVLLVFVLVLAPAVFVDFFVVTVDAATLLTVASLASTFAVSAETSCIGGTIFSSICSLSTDKTFSWKSARIFLSFLSNKTNTTTNAIIMATMIKTNHHQLFAIQSIIFSPFLHINSSMKIFFIQMILIYFSTKNNFYHTFMPKKIKKKRQLRLPFTTGYIGFRPYPR